MDTGYKPMPRRGTVPLVTPYRPIIVEVKHSRIGAMIMLAYAAVSITAIVIVVKVLIGWWS